MRPTKAIVRLDAIKKNLETTLGFAPGANIMAVIKANAYGHGAIEVARALHDRVPAFAVSFLDEALQLREAGIKRPILILQGIMGSADVAEAAANDFWLMLHSRAQVEKVLQTDCARPVRVWIKADTGMHRLGLAVAELDQICEELAASGHVRDKMVLCTHLACSDELANPLTRQQLSRFRACASKYDLPQSIANSAAIMFWPETHAEWNRPGYMLFGNSPLETSGQDSTALVPAMSMTSEIMAIRDVPTGEGVGYGQNWVAQRPSVIGTVSIGYADGYPRHAANGTPVLVNGQRVPLAGRVSMDMITVDLTELEGVDIGDPVELWGQGLSVNEVAAHAGTIGYEILAGLTGRVPVSYVD